MRLGELLERQRPEIDRRRLQRQNPGTVGGYTEGFGGGASTAAGAAASPRGGGVPTVATAWGRGTPALS